MTVGDHLSENVWERNIWVSLYAYSNSLKNNGQLRTEVTTKME